MELGKFHEVSFVVEGFESNGFFEFIQLEMVTDNSTSILEENHQDYFSIYPNPSSGNSTIRIIDSVCCTSVKIYDSIGKTMFFKEEIQNNRVKITNLNIGIYFVVMEMDDIQIISKLVIN